MMHLDSLDKDGHLSLHVPSLTSKRLDNTSNFHICDFGNGNYHSKVKCKCEIRTYVVMSISVSLNNHGPISHRQEDICDFHIRDLQVNL